MADQFYKEPGGTRFDGESGKLYTFESRRVMVYSTWPRVLAWRKTAGSPVWTHFRPEIRVPGKNEEPGSGELTPLHELLDPFLRQASDPQDGEHWPVGPAFRGTARLPSPPWWAWFSRIPPEVRWTVSEFPTRQWHLLAMAARCGDAALDLMRSNPALAFALASNWAFHTPPVARPLRSARALLARGKKQRDILEWLGFPATGSARKALRKLAHPSLSVPRLLYLRDGLHNQDAARLLSHTTRLNAGAVRLVTDDLLLQFVTPSLLEEVAHSAQEDQWPQTAGLLRDTLEMLDHSRADPAGPVIRSIAQLTQLHDTLVDDLDWPYIFEDAAPLLPFPPPPLPGNDRIVPIRTLEEIVHEGEAQRNCVASYAHRVANERTTFIYRVLEPERCTLSIVRRGNDWALGELKTAGNGPVMSDTFAAVFEWLNRARARAAARAVQLSLNFG